MRRIGLSLILICATFISVAAKADTVIKDSRDPANWSDIFEIVDQNFDAEGPSPFVVAPFVGNGRELSKIGINYAHGGGNLEPNQGHPELWDWRIIFWNSFEDYLADPKGQTRAQWWQYHVPSNPDYLEQVGFNGIYNIYYAEVNLEPLHIMTTPGAMQVVTLVANTDNAGANNYPYIANSNCSAGVGGEEDWWSAIPYFDPNALFDMFGVSEHAAFYLTTKSPATCRGPICVSAKAHAQLTYKSACIPGVNC